MNSTIFVLKKVWNAKRDSIFGQRGVVSEIPMPGRKHSGTSFWLASF
jgi:hypothetical protein